MKKRVLVVASNNKSKIKESKMIFKECDIISVNELEKKQNKKIDLNENQDTFKGNAIQKVKELIEQIDENYLCMSDDSGLSIEGLNGFPGVHTARWMEADDHIKNIELIKKLGNNNNRKAEYITSIAIGDKNLINVVEKRLIGKIAKKPRGNNGFGFDEIFELSNGKTLAELSIQEKNKISSRKQALNEIKKYIML